MTNTTAFLQADKIYLREVRESDVNETYYTWLNDPLIRQFLETRYIPRSIENIQEFVRLKSGDANEPFFAICCNETHSHIGNIKIGPINWNQQRADISLLIGEKSYWGQGIATQAIALVTEFAFSQLNLNKLQAGAYHENLGSIKAFLNNKFKKEGYIEEITKVNNKSVDMVVLGITRSQFFDSENK